MSRLNNDLVNDVFDVDEITCNHPHALVTAAILNLHYSRIMALQGSAGHWSCMAGASRVPQPPPHRAEG